MPFVTFIATSEVVIIAPERDGMHGARADATGLTQDTVQFIKSAVAKALFSGGVKASINDAQNHIKTDSYDSWSPFPIYDPGLLPDMPSTNDPSQLQCSVRHTGSRRAHRPASRHLSQRS